MRTAVKVKTVTVVVFTVFNINIAYKNTFTVQESCSPSCRIIQSQIMQADISTIQKSNHHRTVYVVAVRKKLCIAVYNTVAAQLNIIGIFSKYKATVKFGFVSITIVMCIGAITVYIRACQKTSRSVNFQRNIRF